MKRAIALALLLAGCGRQPVKIETVTVRVPVAIECVKRTDVPTHPAKVALTGNAVRDTELLAAQVLRYQAVVNIALGLIEGCVGEGVATSPE